MSSSGLDLKKYLIPLEEIKHATDDFSPHRCIGGGGFGKVYQGQLSTQGQNCITAIKRLDQDSYQGEHEFRNELEMISRFQHKNIIRFFGYCDEGKEMIIIYEYATNGSLDHHLEDPNKRRCITWIQRLQISIGAARGLGYLHSGLGEHNRVIHRDIKSANILLDENLVAKICDFGLSKLGLRNQPETQIYTKVAGTQFYLDPTYHESGILHKESDVYSFGVVLFEMLSGMLVYSRRNIGDDKPQSLINFVRRYYHTSLDKLIDPYIKDEIDSRSFETFKEISYQCISFNLMERPTMDTVIARLEEALSYIQIPDVQNNLGQQDHMIPVNKEYVQKEMDKINLDDSSGSNDHIPINESSKIIRVDAEKIQALNQVRRKKIKDDLKNQPLIKVPKIKRPTKPFTRIQTGTNPTPIQYVIPKVPPPQQAPPTKNVLKGIVIGESSPTPPPETTAGSYKDKDKDIVIEILKKS
ncbi:putative receptor-like protein kinase At5g39000 [Lactuca sativa]|uniref:non-specific serine/threonine protein kinase n=1 Tax=Lactuca sativa TaxID=4236 RepID=A0A9R1WM01_LACSA|nr:putative receptor-like protein kinase At5g39000 [Lactuca sativa]KAJ0226128.1 hypothetical protein LSAT_V11C100036500 [Lactuca sativa]